MSDQKKGIIAQVAFTSKEAMEVFRLFAEGYNDCDLDDETRNLLLEKGDEFKEGVKRLITNLTASSGDSSLKS